jgi:hypothetical protein
LNDLFLFQPIPTTYAESPITEVRLPPLENLKNQSGKASNPD